jgi:hypothetical protein
MGRSSCQSGSVVTLALVARAAAVGLNVLFAACDPGMVGLGASPTFTYVTAVVTITADGINPQVVLESTTCAKVKGNCLLSVRFVNNDTVAHDLLSDPHPDHSTCAPFNRDVGRIEPGQSKEFSMTSCNNSRSYHDETRLDDSHFRGEIVR